MVIIYSLDTIEPPTVHSHFYIFNHNILNQTIFFNLNILSGLEITFPLMPSTQVLNLSATPTYCTALNSVFKIQFLVQINGNQPAMVWALNQSFMVIMDVVFCETAASTPQKACFFSTSSNIVLLENYNCILVWNRFTAGKDGNALLTVIYRPATTAATGKWYGVSKGIHFVDDRETEPTTHVSYVAHKQPDGGRIRIWKWMDVRFHKSILKLFPWTSKHVIWSER